MYGPSRSIIEQVLCGDVNAAYVGIGGMRDVVVTSISLEQTHSNFSFNLCFNSSRGIVPSQNGKTMRFSYQSKLNERKNDNRNTLSVC